MARYTPTELKAAVAMLEEDHDDVEDLARALLVWLHEIRADRQQWVAIVGRRGRVYCILGPFPTSSAARKAALEHGPYVGEGTGAYVMPLGPKIEEGEEQ